jgi:hypothetical protein
MKRANINQLLKGYRIQIIPTAGLPAIIKPQPSAIIPYVKKVPVQPQRDAASCMWQPMADTLALAALEEYDATPNQHHSKPHVLTNN